jgi:tRNA(fMet)-specific endonuclease VapC
MGIVLDSSVFIAAKRKRFDFARFLSAHSTEHFFFTAITASELLHGCERAADATIYERRKRFVEDVFRDYALLPFQLPEAREHARLWVELERKGALIGERDLFIAAIAKTAGHSLATLNRAEFSRIPGLALIEVAAFVPTSGK